jgi:murein L,D-transpeptidase YafK
VSSNRTWAIVPLAVGLGLGVMLARQMPRSAPPEREVRLAEVERHGIDRIPGKRVHRMAVYIRISKKPHEMSLFDADGDRLATYAVSIGAGGMGPKKREGDRVTPTGRYHVVKRGPDAKHHAFMLLDYPNAEDKRRFQEAKDSGEIGELTGIGYAIGIHGGGHSKWIGNDRVFDWTQGCVAVEDAEIDEIAAMVPDGATVDIED